MRRTASAISLVVCGSFVSAFAQNGGAPLKRFWVDEAAGVSIAFPVDHPTLGFTRLTGIEDSSTLAFTRRVLLNQSSAGIVIERGDALCMVRRSFPDQGPALRSVLAQAHAMVDGGKALGQERCEGSIYRDGASEKSFYGVQLNTTPLGLSETCVAAYSTGAGDYPYVVTQQTLFAVGSHGYDLSCSITVRNEADARYLWTGNATDFIAIRDSIAIAPAS